MAQLDIHDGIAEQLRTLAEARQQTVSDLLQALLHGVSTKLADDTEQATAPQKQQNDAAASLYWATQQEITAQFGPRALSQHNLDDRAIANGLAAVIQRLRYEAHIQYHAQILDNLHDAVIATDAEFRITTWNKAAEQMYGWDASEVLDQPVYKVLNAFFNESQLLEAISTLQAEGVYRAEVLQYHRDGRSLFIEGQAVALRENGQVTGYVSVNRDITERKRLEDALRRRVTQVETLLEVSEHIGKVGLDYHAVLHVIVRKITEAVGDMCVIADVSDKGDWLVPVAFYHPDPKVHAQIGQMFAASPLPFDSSIAAVVRERQPLILPDLNREQAQSIVTPAYQPYLQYSGMYGVIIVPLIVQDRVIGTLGVSRITPGQPYTEADLAFLQLLAAHVAMGTWNARYHEEVRAYRDKLQQLAQDVVFAQEEERKRVARELHDETSQALTVLKIRLEHLRRRSDIDQLREEIAGLIALADSAMVTVHNLAQRLRPPELDALGLSLALQTVCDNVSGNTGIHIRFSASELLPFSDVLNITFYRVLQESLTNIVRHAQATLVQVSLAIEDGDAVLRIEDNGMGFDTQSTRQGLGIIGMQERVERLGGRLIIRSQPEGGTSVEAHVPTACAK
jgi:PAS domain S-box-containing protein